VIVTSARLPTTFRTPAEWPFTLAPVVRLAGDGLAFAKPITFLVGENGSGKSTIVEAIAEAFGADVRGGHIGRRYDNSPAKGALGTALQLKYAPQATKQMRKPKGFFLRAESAYGVFQFMSENAITRDMYGGDHLLEVSHGESFLQVVRARFNEPGLYLLDEPEAALSFSSCLTLMVVLREVADRGGQVICATHSPLLASHPDAEIFELSDAGIASVEWRDLALVQHWQGFLDEPARYLRHLLD
jgi:predicted ATPase